MKPTTSLPDIEIEPIQPQLSLEERIEQCEESEIRRLCVAHTSDMVRALVEKATGIKRKLEPNESGYFEIDFDDKGKPKIVPCNDGPAVTSARIVLEHAHGRPTQSVNHTGDRGGPALNITIQQLGDGQPFEIDVSPKREELGDGDRTPERVAAA